MFIAFKYLHILAMFAAVAGAVSTELIIHAVARRGDVAALRGFLPVAERIARLIPIFFVGGALLGFAAALSG